MKSGPDTLQIDPGKPLNTEAPLGPTPHKLQHKRRLSRIRLWAMVCAVGVLGGAKVYWSYRAMGMAAEFTTLAFCSLAAPLFYVVVRRSIHGALWWRVSRTYPLYGRVHPAARGELPRNLYCMVFSLPFAAGIGLSLILLLTGLWRQPHMELFLTVLTITALGDIWSLFQCLAAQSKTWIMERENGLDVLKLDG
jgi:hypothetical protein